MQYLRKFGFFALVAVALTACGAAASAGSVTTEPPSPVPCQPLTPLYPGPSAVANATATAAPAVCPSSTPTPSVSSSTTSSPSSATGCPVTTQYETQFCLTDAEAADGQTIVHDPTIPDEGLIQQGMTLTIGPNDVSAITQQQAENGALAFLTDPSIGTTTATVNSAMFCEMHGTNGLPTDGELVWIVDVSPPGGAVMVGGSGNSPSTVVPYEEVIVNAVTGQAMYTRVGP